MKSAESQQARFQSGFQGFSVSMLKCRITHPLTRSDHGGVLRHPLVPSAHTPAHIPQDFQPFIFYKSCRPGSAVHSCFIQHGTVGCDHWPTNARIGNHQVGIYKKLGAKLGQKMVAAKAGISMRSAHRSTSRVRRPCKYASSTISQTSHVQPSNNFSSNDASMPSANWDNRQITGLAGVARQPQQRLSLR